MYSVRYLYHLHMFSFANSLLSTTHIHVYPTTKELTNWFYHLLLQWQYIQEHLLHGLYLFHQCEKCSTSKSDCHGQISYAVIQIVFFPNIPFSIEWVFILLGERIEKEGGGGGEGGGLNLTLIIGNKNTRILVLPILIYQGVHCCTKVCYLPSWSIRVSIAAHKFATTR